MLIQPHKLSLALDTQKKKQIKPKINSCKPPMKPSFVSAFLCTCVFELQRVYHM